MSGEDLERQDSDEEDRVSRLVTRLQDLLVEEISTVDRAANKRRFLVIKTEGDTMPTGKEVFEQEDGTLATEDVDKGAGDAFGTVDAGDNIDNTPADDSVDGTDKATPKGVKDAVMSMLEDSAKKIDALVAKLKEAKGMIPPPMLGEGKAIVTALRGVASRYPSPKAKSEDEPENADDATVDDVSKADAQAAAKALAALKSKIDALVTKVKGLEEGEGSLPGDINKAIDEIAMGVESALGLAKADMPEDDKEPEGGGAMTAQQAMAESVKLLQVALGKLAAGKPCDEEAVRMVAKARDMLAQTAKTKTKKTEEPEPTDDREPTEKAGTKQLSRARREKFKGALDALIKLFEEMIPEAERKSMWPTKKAAEAPEPVKKNDETDPEVVELRKTIDEQNAKIEKLQGAIKDRDDAPTDTNLVPVSKGDDGENVKPISWEHDLNDPDVDAW